MKEAHHILRARLVLAAMIAIAFGLPTLAADPPVTITFANSGSPLPGASISTKATIKINDGSTLQSLTWTQTGGTPVTLSNTAGDTVTIALADRTAYKQTLVKALSEFPITTAQFPSYVPIPGTFQGGLQDRFGVVGVTPYGLAALNPKLNLKVVTSSGTYNGTTTITLTAPWPTSIGTRNVPRGIPVILQGKKQATYDWTLIAPAGSSATLSGATTRNPEFTPDIAGEYAIAVTDGTGATGKPVKLTVYADNWQGIVTGESADGGPAIEPTCNGCHLRQFVPWKKTGHARIFIDNVKNTAPDAHYRESCLSCHTVGFSTLANNGGIDDALNYKAFVDSGLLTHGAADNWTKIAAQYPEVARMTGIQCESCHGPQGPSSHMKKDGSRINLSSDVCGTCHGRPANHGRYQQWQISKHASYETAAAEGTNASCAKCHSAQGFVAWAKNNFSDAAIKVTWTTDEVHPITCQTCHDPHDEGTVEEPKVRIMGSTPKLAAGFEAKEVGSAAICMMCHNGRRGLKDDAHFDIAQAARAPHLGPQADIVMGQNLYLTEVGKVGMHGKIEDSCITCHLGETNPPAALSSNFAGTNHTFFASKEICANCHEEMNAEEFQGEIEEKLEALKVELENALQTVMQLQIRLGKTINVGTLKSIKDARDVAAVELTESHGQQAIIVTLGNGTKLEAVALGDVKAVPPAGTAVPIYALADPNVAKAGWNFFMVEADKSKGVHNPPFVNSALDVSLFAVKSFNATGGISPTTPGLNYVGGGPGTGAGAVACQSSYVYWAEIAGRASGGNGSQWRTDLVARNLSSSNATLKFIFHQSTGNLESSGSIVGSAQMAFEDIVASLGATNAIGSLEICSDRPLLVRGRIFNDAGELGTFGQSLFGHVADQGYAVGETVNLIGLRQKLDRFRTNLTVTNAGKTAGEVAIKLYDDDGTLLTSYNLTIPAGQVVMDNEPFKNRAGAPDLGWGYATVTIVKGSNIQTSASLIDSRTNDPMTIEPKQ